VDARHAPVAGDASAAALLLSRVGVAHEIGFGNEPARRTHHVADAGGEHRFGIGDGRHPAKDTEYRNLSRGAAHRLYIRPVEVRVHEYGGHADVVLLWLSGDVEIGVVDQSRIRYRLKNSVGFRRVVSACKQLVAIEPHSDGHSITGRFPRHL
jgi:hypothetical protein